MTQSLDTTKSPTTTVGKAAVELDIDTKKDQSHNDPLCTNTNKTNTTTMTIDYFAIGSMMNRISIISRNIHPIRSEPAILLNHKIGFFSNLGVAEPIPIVPKDNKNKNKETENEEDEEDETMMMHGVIHTLSISDMEALDVMEGSEHERKNAMAQLYDGTIIPVTVYVRGNDHIIDDQNSENDNDNHTTLSPTNLPVPNQRYVDIMIEGCEYYGVDKKYIEHLRKHPTKPRYKVEEYKQFPIPNDVQNVFIDYKTIQDNDGTHGKELYFVVNSKVLVMSHTADPKLHVQFNNLFNKNNEHYRICDVPLGQMIYEPMYGIPHCIKDMTPEHSAFCEHIMIEYMETKSFIHTIRMVGFIQKESIMIQEQEQQQQEPQQES